MNIVIQALQQPFNYVIIVLGIVAFWGYISTSGELGKLNKEMDDNAKKSRGRKEYSKGGVKYAPSVDDWEDTLNFLESFNKIKAKYSMWGQMVPIFPLLGLLGTVIGLMMQLGQGIGTDGQLDAMALSMTTTFCGLVVSIILKVFDALVVGKAINSRQLYFDAYESNYHMVIDKKTVEESND
ncbi:MAG: MotA/TolQ/ExbB proton channel family protein [Lachnospiraceae bacterium]|nr:MotA/TolQ/ExbB proton channel family protein [Lachnospiraceae bacterium]